MSKHTPGPWGFRHGFNIVGTNGRLVANCGGHSQNFDIDKNEAESEANAYLIAAAPELLEALETISSKVWDNSDWFDHAKELRQIAREAIAKAEGK